MKEPKNNAKSVLITASVCFFFNFPGALMVVQYRWDATDQFQQFACHIVQMDGGTD